MLLAFSSSGSWPGNAQELPQHTGWVTDLADLFTQPEERALEARLDAYFLASRNELAILTVTSLEGRSIESLGLETARAWGIGQKETQRGALLVLATEDHAMRLEVGRGLEGELTDSISGRILRDVLAPQLRADHPYEGVNQSLDAIEAALSGDPARVEAALPAQSIDPALWINLGIILLVVLLAIRRRRRRGYSRGWMGGLPLGGLPLGRSLGGGGFSGGGGFRGFGGGGGFSGGGASGRW